ncbi:MAG: 5'/3'-nucleotidase SurE [Blastocatellia bacterium]|nr:5'/3'-nucleotidase SurE [Blastocatellia bacterium]
MKRILVTNDDGIDSEGIKALAESLQTIGNVVVVAPSSDMTAVSHSITLNRPLKIDEVAPNRYSVEGTPTDCVVLAINLVMKDSPPDLVVSGINKGANLGDDVHYSGTVAGAVEATMYKIPAIAVSLAGRNSYDFTEAAKLARLVAEKVLSEGLPKGTFLNVNLPRSPIKGVVVTRQGTKIARTNLIETKDPRKRSYYWIGGDYTHWEQEKGTDIDAVRRGYASITPLKNDMTNNSHLSALQSWDSNWLAADSVDF